MKITWLDAALTRALVVRRRWPWFWIREEAEIRYEPPYWIDKDKDEFESEKYLFTNGGAVDYDPFSNYSLWKQLSDSRHEEEFARKPVPPEPPSPWRRVLSAAPRARALPPVDS